MKTTFHISHFTCRISRFTIHLSPLTCRTVKGFTLLEVMIALAIMAGVIFTVISSFNYHLGIVTTDREETIAVLLARAKLDDPVIKTPEEKKGTFAPDWPGISWEVATTPTELPGVNRLTLTVSWDNARRTLALVRYLAK